MQCLIAGYEKNTRYLGYVDLYGLYLEDDYFATGLAKYLCPHIIETGWNEQCTLEEALSVIEQCFQVLFARHCPAGDGLQVVVLNEQGIRIDRKVIKVEWDFEQFKNKPAIIPTN